jgi:hypothetical protein
MNKGLFLSLFFKNVVTIFHFRLKFIHNRYSIKGLINKAQIVLLVLFGLSSQSFAQKNCGDYLFGDAAAFKKVSSELLLQNYQSPTNLFNLAFYSTGGAHLVTLKEGSIKDQYFEMAEIAAKSGVLRLFLENLISRFHSLKLVLSEEDWLSIEKMLPMDISLIKTQINSSVASVKPEDLSDERREAIGELILILTRRLDKSGFEALSLGMPLQRTNINFYGPYSAIASSIIQEAMRVGKLNEVFKAVRDYFANNGYSLTIDEIKVIMYLTGELR